jgi:superfamily II DNA or RNA helicase
MSRDDPLDATRDFLRRSGLHLTGEESEDDLREAVAWITEHPHPMGHLANPGLESGIIERDKFQREAVSAVLQAYQTNDRCQMYAPTGSGKTRVAAKVWSDLAEPGICVIVSPTRNVAQTEEHFRRYYEQEPSPATQDAHYLQVNSNPDATRDLNRISRFLSQPGPRLVFATDTSLPLVTKALQALSRQADLFVIDETHRNTSARASDSPRAQWAEEAVINLPARRRLYMTATPRTWDAESDDLIIFSQDDEEKYGPVAYELSFDDAVRRGIVLPIVLYALQPEDEKIANQFMADPNVRQVWDGQAMDYREIITHVAIWRARTEGLPDQDHPDERYRPSRILVSFNRVAEVKGFVTRHERIMRFLAERHPELAPVNDGMAFAVLGSTPAAEREEIHESVSKLQGPAGSLGYAMIAQCGALTESYDLPDLDMAILVTPKDSTVAIQQLIGRVTRKPVTASGKRWASVITTDLGTDNDELADTIIVGVVRALMVQSETFRHQLQETDVRDDNGPPPVRIVGDMSGQPLPDAFFEKLRLTSVRVGRESFFVKFIAHLDEYIAAYGYARVPWNYVCKDGYRLGDRVRYVRSCRAGSNSLVLTSEMIAALDARSFTWRILEQLGFPAFLQHLDEYIAAYGDAHVSHDYVSPDGYLLGKRAARKRQQRRELHLSWDEVKKLDAREFVWSLAEDRFQQFISHFSEYCAEHNGAVPSTYVCADGYRLGYNVKAIQHTLLCQSCERPGIGCHFALTPDQVAEVEAIGFTMRVKPIRPPAKSLVADVLTNASRPLTQGEIAALADLGFSTAGARLAQLEKDGKAIRYVPPGHGKGQGARSHLWQCANKEGAK